MFISFNGESPLCFPGCPQEHTVQVKTFFLKICYSKLHKFFVCLSRNLRNISWLQINNWSTLILCFQGRWEKCASEILFILQLHPPYHPLYSLYHAQTGNWLNNFKSISKINEGSFNYFSMHIQMQRMTFVKVPFIIALHQVSSQTTYANGVYSHCSDSV